MVVLLKMGSENVVKRFLTIWLMAYFFGCSAIIALSGVLVAGCVAIGFPLPWMGQIEWPLLAAFYALMAILCTAHSCGQSLAQRKGMKR